MGEGVLEKITAVLKARKHSTAQESYVASLYAQGTAGIGAKVMEEAEEVCVAAEHESGQALSHEVADLWLAIIHDAVVQTIVQALGKHNYLIAP
ncbi:MAG: phosphoribosyl-ATP diphosphatase [Candidatus Oxydemutatoraceae bacterium WSBS_2016_MAG_OTU14]